jgi:hypothetical protein
LVGAGEALWKESRLAVGGALNAELAHPVPKGIGMEIQNPQRHLRPIHHSISLLNGGQDMASRPAACDVPARACFSRATDGSSYPSRRTAEGLQKRQVPSGPQPKIPSAAESSMSRTRSSLFRSSSSAFFRSMMSSESATINRGMLSVTRARETLLRTQIRLHPCADRSRRPIPGNHSCLPENGGLQRRGALSFLDITHA